ncbi:MAG TPA: hypothetical protein PLS49_07065 [Candidatus Woesebacteria bacterium]|nr:hypothetical protein [Candidatus Woesebacteria bacterium]
MISLKQIILENDDSYLTEWNPFRRITQGFHTRKVLKAMPDTEKKELGRFLRDKKYVELARMYHTAPDAYTHNIYKKAMRKYVDDRTEDKELTNKIVGVTQDPEFDVSRNRLATKLLVPKDSIPQAPPPELKPSVVQKQAAEKEKNDNRTRFGRWIRSAKIVNPKTGNKIKILSVLNKGEEHPAFTQAKSMIDAKIKQYTIGRINLKSYKGRLNAPKKNAYKNIKNRMGSARSKINKRKSSINSPNPSFNPTPFYGGSFGGSSGFKFAAARSPAVVLVEDFNRVY